MTKKKIKINRIHIVILLILIILVVGNTYAWMMLSNSVSTGIDVHIKSWNIDFKDSSDDLIENTYNIDVTNIYPGMPNFEDVISINNTGEIDGEISYTILEVKILDDEYISEEERTIKGETIEENDLTSDELIDKLSNDFPFSINFNLSNDEVEVESSETFTTTVTWAYESGDDELDTVWGNNAYHFHETNTDVPSIQIKLVIKVKQKTEP